MHCSSIPTRFFCVHGPENTAAVLLCALIIFRPCRECRDADRGGKKGGSRGGGALVERRHGLLLDSVGVALLA